MLSLGFQWWTSLLFGSWINKAHSDDHQHYGFADCAVWIIINSTVRISRLLVATENLFNKEQFDVEQVFHPFLWRIVSTLSCGMAHHLLESYLYRFDYNDLNIMHVSDGTLLQEFWNAGHRKRCPARKILHITTGLSFFNKSS